MFRGLAEPSQGSGSGRFGPFQCGRGLKGGGGGAGGGGALALSRSNSTFFFGMATPERWQDKTGQDRTGQDG